MVPLSVVFLSALVEAMVESNADLQIRGFRDAGRDYDGYGDPKYGGKAIIGFSLAGVVAALWIVVAGMKSRQDDQDAATRACLFERGSPVP